MPHRRSPSPTRTLSLCCCQIKAWKAGHKSECKAAARAEDAMKNLAAMHLNWEGCEQVSILKSPLYCEFLHSEYTRALTFENLWQDENAVRYTRTAAELTADQMRVLEILEQLDGAAHLAGRAALERARAVAACSAGACQGGGSRRADCHAEHACVCLLRTAMPRQAAWVYSTRNAYQSLGDYAKAIEYHGQDLAIAQEVGDRAGEGMAYASTYANLGCAYYSLGDYAKAIEYHAQSLSIAKVVGDRAGEGRARCMLASGARISGRGTMRRPSSTTRRAFRLQRSWATGRGVRSAGRTRTSGLRMIRRGPFPRPSGHR